MYQIHSYMSPQLIIDLVFYAITTIALARLFLVAFKKIASSNQKDSG